MPCTLEPWEVDAEEREENAKKYGIELTDLSLMTRLLCEAVKLIPVSAVTSNELKLWTIAHKKRDRMKNGRKKKGTK